MTVKWTREDGSRWSTAEMVRVQALFRRHVRTECHPRGRIIREPCFFCIRKILREGFTPKQAMECAPLGEAHHLDYALPFKVVWLCPQHHRDVDQGGLHVPKAAIYDYTSLVECIGRAHLRGEKKERTPDGTPF